MILSGLVIGEIYPSEGIMDKIIIGECWNKKNEAFLLRFSHRWHNSESISSAPFS